MINIIWFFLIAIGIIYSLFTGNISNVNNELLNSGKKVIEMMLFLIPNIALWNGIMTIAHDSGLLNKLTKLLYPVLKKLFPDIPKNHESLDYIASNVVINIAGLGNAATPIGLKAMKSLQELNEKKDVASKSMITFLILNTTGLTLIPTTIIGLRSSFNSNDPSIILIPTLISTIVATILGLLIDWWYRKHK